MLDSAQDAKQNLRKNLSIWLLILLVDQVSKYFAVHNLHPGFRVNAFFCLSLVRNSGGAFGVLPGRNMLFIVISLVVIALIIALCRRETTSLHFVVILAGLSGNLIDRIRYGYVIDFLDFHFWPVFNIADIAICSGVAFLCWREGVSRRSLRR